MPSTLHLSPQAIAWLVDTLVSKTEAQRSDSRAAPPLMVGISGIDGSGKGYVSELLSEAVKQRLEGCVLIGVDGWLEPPVRRFSAEDPAGHFYERGFRFDELQDQLLTPLARHGSVDTRVQLSSPTDDGELTPRHIEIRDTPFVLVEGIFLFQPRFDFDYRIWIECSVETALERALERNQEGLDCEALIADYETIYFPAQHLHQRRDRPRDRCDVLLINDPRLL